MKKIYFFVIASLFFFMDTKGQNITLDQVISLNNKSVAGVEEFLTSKNWNLIEAKEPADGLQGSVTFAFKKQIFDDRALSFLTYYYGRFSKNSNRINIQINSTNMYNSFLARLKTLGFKLTSSFVKDGEIKKIYSGKSNVIEVTTGTQQEDYSTKTTYQFYIQNSFEYNRNQNDYINSQIDNGNISIDTIVQYTSPNLKQEAEDAYESNDFTNAAKLYIKLFNLGYSDSVDLYKIGYSYYMLQNYKNAILYFKKYEAFDSVDASAKDIISYSYYSLNDFNNAIKYSLSAIKLDDSNIDYYSSLGWYYILNKKFKNALEYLERAKSIEIDTESEPNYYFQGNLAHAYLLTGNYVEAKNIYLKYKGIVIDDNETWNSMVLKDFDKFKQKKITSVKILEITKLLKQ